MSNIPKGYKQTEVEVIPKDWEVKKLGEIAIVATGNTPPTKDQANYGSDYFFVSPADLGKGKYITDTEKKLSEKGFEISRRFPKNSILFTCIGSTIGKSGIAPKELTSNQQINAIFPSDNFCTDYLFYALSLLSVKIKSLAGEQAVPIINKTEFGQTLIPLPPTKAEQTAIAAALSDADALIQSLEKLIAKKRNIKQGAMQELLKPKDGWMVKTLEESTHCLDNLRIPLNESQRAMMKGDIPYCGANGILDYINDYCIDDDIILIAEDGGYFDEYAHRPIAYKMSGKCWVNNHAHILKAKEDMSQDFIFYSLVHKNILRFLASGTRAKLNKSEMYKIEIDAPPTVEAQTRIATILSDMDAEIEALGKKLAKYRQIKQGMMQELLTGRIRLV